MNRFKRTAIKVAAITTGVLLAGGIASAYWSVSGGGTGTATTVDNLRPLTVEQLTKIDGMYPGSEYRINGTVTNPNVVQMQVNNIAAAITVDEKHADNCAASNYYVVQVLFNNGKPGWMVGPNGDVDQWYTYLGMYDSKSNQDGCLGAVVTITYTIS